MSTITETRVDHVEVGMVRQWNQGTSTITAIVRESPRSSWMLVTYRSDTASLKPEGVWEHNTVTVRARRGSYLPIVSA